MHEIRKICFALDKDWHDSIMRSDGLSLTTTTTEGNSSLAVITNIYIGRGESNHLKDIGKTGLAMVKSLEIQVSGIRSFVVAVFNRYFILVRYK